MEPALSGRRVLILRDPEAGAVLARRIAELGGTADARPSFRLVTPADPGAARVAAAHLERYAWVAVTSANGVRFLRRFMDAAGTTWPEATRLAVVGPATRSAAEAQGWPVAVCAELSRAEGLADALHDRAVAGERLLWVRPEHTRPVLADRLTREGIHVDAVVFYRNVPSAEAAAIGDDLVAGRYAAVVLGSPSALLQLLSATDRPELLERLKELPAVAIGPVTATAWRERVATPIFVARQPTDEEQLRALLEALRGAA